MYVVKWGSGKENFVVTGELSLYANLSLATLTVVETLVMLSKLMSC